MGARIIPWRISHNDSAANESIFDRADNNKGLAMLHGGGGGPGAREHRVACRSVLLRAESGISDLRIFCQS